MTTNNKSAETTTAATTANEQMEDADGEELNALISNLVREMNSRPGSNPDQTGEIVHRLLKSARDIQGEKNGLATKAQCLRLAIVRHNEYIISQAAAADNSIQ